MTSKCKRYCSVPQCNQYKDTNVSIHSFPADAKLRKVWQNVLKIGKPISKYMSVCSKHFLQTDYKGKWNPNAKVHCLRPNAIPSQSLPVTLHQNIKPVIARSFRKRRNMNESDQDKACSNIEFPHHSDETDRTTDEVFMENASVENIRTEIEKPSTSREPLLHDQEPLKNVVEFLDKGTQSNIVSSFEERLDTERKCIYFTGVRSENVNLVHSNITDI